MLGIQRSVVLSMVRVRVLLFLPKTQFLGLTPLSFDTTALRKSYLNLALNCEIIPQNACFLSKKKVIATVFYGIETLYQTYFQTFLLF